MEEAFNKLQTNNYNTVDNLVMWMKVSKIVDGNNVTEEKARSMFSEVKDASNVELGNFEEAIGTLAKEQKKSLEELCKVLAAEGPKFLNAVIAAANAAANAAGVAAANAFKEAFKNK